MPWKAYAIPPIDFFWENLPTIHIVAKSLNNEAYKFVENFELAKALVRNVGWEGDFREEPRVFFLPGDVRFDYGFVWKQDNNGITFIATPHELPWLDRLCFE